MELNISFFTAIQPFFQLPGPVLCELRHINITAHRLYAAVIATLWKFCIHFRITELHPDLLGSL